jgi:hypothetical protein
MTNTLHRFGKPEDLKDDHIVFTLTSPGINDIGAMEKERDFLRIALKYNPVNLAGTSKDGPIFRPEKNLNLFELYIKGRKETVSPEQVIEEMEPSGRTLVVFDNKQAVEGFLKEVKEADSGLSAKTLEKWPLVRTFDLTRLTTPWVSGGTCIVYLISMCWL